MKNQLKFIASNPQVAFMDTLMKITTSNDPRTVFVPTVKQLDQVNLDKLYKFYCDRFADASDFTFFFVGKFNNDSLIPKIAKYLGGLPSTGRKETFKDVSPKFPATTTEVEIKKGIAEKGMVGIVMNDNFEWNDQNRLDFNMMVEVVKIKLREKIREDEGGTYGLQVRPDVSQYPKPEYNLMFNFGCDPDRAKKLVKQVFEVLEGIQKDGPDTAVMSKVKTTLIREREVSLKENNFWVRKIESEYYNNDPIKSLSDYNDRINKVTPDEVKKMANKYITLNHYVEVILVPEKSKK